MNPSCKTCPQLQWIFPRWLNSWCSLFYLSIYCGAPFWLWLHSRRKWTDLKPLKFAANLQKRKIVQLVWTSLRMCFKRRQGKWMGLYTTWWSPYYQSHTSSTWTSTQEIRKPIWLTWLCLFRWDPSPNTRWIFRSTINLQFCLSDSAWSTTLKRVLKCCRTTWQKWTRAGRRSQWCTCTAW